jgi:hypothetical protein
MTQETRIGRQGSAHPRQCATLLAGALLFAATAGAGAGDEPPTEDPRPRAEPGAVEVRFTEGSVLKLKLRDDKVEIVTPYGTLLVPVAEVQRIEFATRISEAEQKRIPVLVAQLGSPDFATREAATAELLALREKAYPALLQAEKSKDLEVTRRAGELLDKIREAVPAEDLEFRPEDVIHTRTMKLAGRISNPTLKATTSQFGDVTLKLADMRSLRSQALADPEDAEAEMAPPSLAALQNQVGTTFRFKVTGAVGGGVWGTDVYTLDSSLAVAAVHAGVLKPGQTGVVKVKIVPPPPAFRGSTRHGITSEGYGVFGGAFRILK